MSESNADKDENLIYQVYLEERRSLVNFKFEETRLFDKAILTLTGGAFGLSLALFKQIPELKTGTILILGIAWGSFCVSLLSTLISFLTSQCACSKQLEILEAEYFPKNCQQKTGKIKNKAKTYTTALSVISIAFFIVGAISLAVFSFINLSS